MGKLQKEPFGDSLWLSSICKVHARNLIRHCVEGLGFKGNFLKFFVFLRNYNAAINDLRDVLNDGSKGGNIRVTISNLVNTVEI